jgi:hypothetical protein
MVAWDHVGAVKSLKNVPPLCTAEVLKVSKDLTVLRDLKKAKSWLMRYLVENR